MKQKLQLWQLLPPAQEEIIAAFQEDLAAKLAGSASSLSLLPSFLLPATGQEEGEFLALDFGGTNARMARIRLDGQGRHKVLKQVSRPLGVHLTAAGHAEGLFDFLASLAADIIDPEERLPLGHTFSFPCEQTNLQQAQLLRWSKEIATPGVIGQDVNQLLCEAFARAGLQIQPVAIINDTIATLLAGTYLLPGTQIGSILGTGHNTAYFEPSRNMLLNLESGAFRAIPENEFDAALDAASLHPGEQPLEKRVSGRYLGELVQLALLKEHPHCGLTQPYCVTPFHLAAWLHPGERCPFPLPPDVVGTARQLAQWATLRSARLAALTYVALFRHLGSSGPIAIDGSLYEHLPGYASMVRVTLEEHGYRIPVRLLKGGSALGAALAACAASKNLL